MHGAYWWHPAEGFQWWGVDKVFLNVQNIEKEEEQAQSDLYQHSSLYSTFPKLSASNDVAIQKIREQVSARGNEEQKNCVPIHQCKGTALDSQHEVMNHKEQVKVGAQNGAISVCLL